MLIDLFPRAHARFAALPLLGSQLDRFVRWLDALGFARLPIRQRIRKTPRLDNLLHCGGVRELSKLSPGRSCWLSHRAVPMTTFTYPLWFVRRRPIWKSEGRSLPPVPRLANAWR